MSSFSPTSAPRERMLRLLSLLQAGRRWSATELAAEAGCTPRTLRRDLDYLRELGYPVRSVRGPGGYYQLAAGRALPPLMLEDDEAIATVLGLSFAAAGDAVAGSTAAAAQRAGEKLRRVLPPKLQRSTANLLAAVALSPVGEQPPAPALLKSVAEAIAEQRSLHFKYHGKKAETVRQVEPARVLRRRERWYLFGWDQDRQDWRSFRLDRIASPPAAGLRFSPRALPAADLLSYLGEQFRGGEWHTITLTLFTSAQEAAARLHRIDGVLEPLGAERCRYTAHVDSYQWLTLVLVLSEIDFSVESPEEFRRHLAAQAQRLLYATGGFDR